VNDWGLRTRDTAKVRGGPPPTTTLYGLLRNPFYMGVIATSAGTFDGEHEPMVTRDDFERVQRLIASEGTARPSRNAFVYAGLLHCGRCGRLLTGERIVKPSALSFTYYGAAVAGKVTNDVMPLRHARMMSRGTLTVISSALSFRNTLHSGPTQPLRGARARSKATTASASMLSRGTSARPNSNCVGRPTASSEDSSPKMIS